MTKTCVSLDEKRKDAAEFLEILDKVPEERKGEVLCIMKGFALCAENDAVSKEKDKDNKSA